MPPKPASSTPHSRRIEAIRERMKHVIARIPDLTDNPSKITKAGQFARSCHDLALQRGIKWARRSYGIGTIAYVLKGGGAYEHNLDVMELACIEWEQKFRQERALRSDKAFDADLPEAVSIDKLSPTERQNVITEITGRSWEPPHHAVETKLWSDDPEIDAMSRAKDALEPLDGEARRRVLYWVARRFGFNVVEEPLSRG